MRQIAIADTMMNRMTGMCMMNMDIMMCCNRKCDEFSVRKKAR